MKKIMYTAAIIAAMLADASFAMQPIKQDVTIPDGCPQDFNVINTFVMDNIKEAIESIAYPDPYTLHDIWYSRMEGIDKDFTTPFKGVHDYQLDIYARAEIDLRFLRDMGKLQLSLREATIGRSGVVLAPSCYYKFDIRKVGESSIKGSVNLSLGFGLKDKK